MTRPICQRSGTCRHESFRVRSRVRRLRLGGVVCRRRSRGGRRRRQRRQGGGDQRRPQPDRRARPRRAAGALRRPKDACARRPTPRTPFATARSRCSASARRAGRTAASISRISNASASRSARRCKDKPGYHVVVVRSTVLPGTTHGVVIPALERESGKKYGDGFGVSVNPEFLREGTALKDFRKPPLTLVGHNHAADASGTIALYQSIDAPLISTSIRVAEMMKYTSNTWHALKVVLRERDRQPVQEAGRRQPRGDGHLLPRREAEPVAVLPQARVRVRRLVPAEGRARAAVPRQGSGRRAAADLADPAEQQGADSAGARSGARDRQEEGRPARLQLQGGHRRPAREPDRHPRRGAARQGHLAAASTTRTSRSPSWSARTRSTSRSRSRTCRRCSATRSTR